MALETDLAKKIEEAAKCKQKLDPALIHAYLEILGDKGPKIDEIVDVLLHVTTKFAQNCFIGEKGYVSGKATYRSILSFAEDPNVLFVYKMEEHQLM